MSETGAQHERITILEAELAQVRSQITHLQQDNDRSTAQCELFRQSELRYRQVVENSPISIRTYAKHYECGRGLGNGVPQKGALPPLPPLNLKFLRKSCR